MLWSVEHRLTRTALLLVVTLSRSRAWRGGGDAHPAIHGYSPPLAGLPLTMMALGWVRGLGQRKVGTSVGRRRHRSALGPGWSR